MHDYNVTLEVKRGRAPVDGGELFWEMTGEGDAVVMLHGSAMDRRMWEPQIEAFSKSFRMIRYDQRGYGRSTAPEPGVAFSHAEDLALLLDHLKLDSAALVGASMGGQNALEFAIRFPRRVSALVVAGAPLQGQPLSEEATTVFAAIELAVSTEGLQAAKSLWLASPLFERVLQTGQRELLQVIVDEYSGWHWQHPSPNKILEPPMAEQLAALQVPTLVMIGEHDDDELRAAADLLTERIPGVRRLDLDGVGHFPNLEDPLRFDALVLGFLRRARLERG